MGVRVRIRIKSSRGEAETPALVNTGFETEEPEILLPVKLAEKLGLYPPNQGSVLEELFEIDELSGFGGQGAGDDVLYDSAVFLGIVHGLHQPIIVHFV